MAPKLAIDIHASSSDLTSQQINILSTTGNNTVIPGQPGMIIRVFMLVLNVSAATNITWQDGPSPAVTAKVGPFYFAANQGIVVDFNTKAWLTCSAGNDFVINQSGTANIGGAAYYTIESA